MSPSLCREISHRVDKGHMPEHGQKELQTLQSDVLAPRILSGIVPLQRRCRYDTVTGSDVTDK